MSKTKSLLSFALAATMLFSTVFVGANAEDATPKTGTLEIGTATVEVGEPTATVDFTLTFDEAVKSPHSLCAIVSDYELTKLAVKSVDGTVVADDENLAEGDDDLVSSATVKISNNGLNLAAKKVIFESGVDANAPIVTTIVFTATFDTSAAVAGTSVVSAEIDATNYDENTFALTVNAGEIVVVAPHEHNFVGEETTPATCTTPGVKTFTCECGKDSYTEEIPVIPHNFVDGTCDVCGAADPDYVPEEPECEHEWDIVSYELATSATPGNLTIKCAKCDAEESHTTAYNGVYSFSTSSASYKDRIEVNFKSISQFWTNPDKIERFLVVTNKEYFEKDAVLSDMPLSKGAPTTIPIAGTDYVGKMWSVPIPAAEMNDEIEAFIFVELDGKWYNGSTYTQSFVGYAAEMLSSNASSKEKSLLVNALNYGGKAQIRFGVDPENPAYNTIPDEYLSLIPENEPEISGTVNYIPDGSVDKIFRFTSSMSAESKVEMNHYFMASGFDDIENLTFKATFQNSYGVPQEVILVNRDVATPEQLESGQYFYPATANGINGYKLVFSGTAASEMRELVTFVPYDADGNAVGSELVCSIENLVNDVIANINNDAEVAMYKAMLHYCDAAKAMFS